jgi:hypothetical protein
LGSRKIAMLKLACQIAIGIAQPNNCIRQTSLRLLLRHCVTFYANELCLVVSIQRGIILSVHMRELYSGK